MDELAEQHELSNEIANAISSPVGMYLLISFIYKIENIFETV